MATYVFGARPRERRVSPGDHVVYLLDVDLYGVGVIRGVLKDGRLAVEFDGAVDHFDAQELELASVWAQRRTLPEAA